jgi:hypothetical protein
MKTFTLIAGTIIIYCFPLFVAAQYQYISPLPGSKYKNPETNIILKNGDPIDPKSLNSSLINISGSLSGLHTARIVLSNDGKTIVVYPSPKFAEGETVAVAVSDGFKKKSGAIITGVDFQFDIHAKRSASDLLHIQNALKYVEDSEFKEAGLDPQSFGGNTTRDLCAIPDFTITSNGDEYKGDLFYYNFKTADSGCFARTIMTSGGDSIFAAFDPKRGIGWDINRNGYLTYFSYEDTSFEMMDSSYNVLKHFKMANGYSADQHEFVVFPDGHSFMVAYDVQPGIDLTAYGGLDSVDVIGCVIQELDSDMNVIFEWSTWDHFEFDDAIFWVVIPNVSIFDWVHINSMELDADGNLLVSCRNLCEITKVDLGTGDILWRMGGENNQFTFVNDPDVTLPFSGQHDIRRLPNGRFTLFNNGNKFIPEQSSAKEYAIDEVNKIATLAWMYKHPDVNSKKVFAPAMGSVQRLPNGNTLIDWGLISVSLPLIPRFSEVDSAGTLVWEFNFDTEYFFSYRAFKYDWNRCAPPPDSSLTLTYVGSDSASFTWSAGNFNTGYVFLYKLLGASSYTAIPIATNSISLSGLEANSIYQWQVQSICETIDDTSSFSLVNEFNTLATTIVFNNGIDIPFSLYPNPAEKMTNVAFVLKQAMPLTVRIMNLVGEKVFEETFVAAAGFNQKVITTDQLPAGVYFVELAGDGVSARRQLVVR